MDWVEEKLQKIRYFLRNTSMKKALACYVLLFIVITLAAALITVSICSRWEIMIWKEYDFQHAVEGEAVYTNMVYGGMTEWDSFLMTMLKLIKMWCPCGYAILSMIAVSVIFYKKRLQIPFSILEQGMQNIRKNHLDFILQYDSQDEMGQLCVSFEEMRKEVVKNKADMKAMLEEKQRLNAAFAHDLRTPLTVLRGYTDIMLRYLPEGKITEAKLMDTLSTMAEHIMRLERYSNTMKNIHSLEDMPFLPKRMDAEQLWRKIQNITEALDEIGAVSVRCEVLSKKAYLLLVDETIILEVTENLLSNAIRYAQAAVEVTLDLNEELGCLNLYVKDDGAGFTKEALQQALVPYYHEPQPVEDKHFGIGLHICRLLCEKHGGSVSLSNSVTEGAIVSASFACR